MTNDRNNRMADVNTAPPTTALMDWRQHLIIPGAILFIVSLVFPMIASLSGAKSFPVWVGYLDAGLAFVLVVVMILIGTSTKGKVEDRAAHISYRVYRVAISLPLVLLVAFFIFGDRIKWNVLLPGLAWRTWLLLYVLPAGLTALGVNTIVKDQVPNDPGMSR